MRLALLASAAVLAFAASSARAEEGMWTFDNFPIARANQTLGTNIDQAFLDRVRLSSVKFGGCSAGVVSGQGLVMTNNHCVATCVANLSTPQVNYAETGFTPKSREEELKCPGASAEILTDISDVTERMRKAGEGLEGQAFTQARDAEAGRIETEACGDDAKVRCQVVSLYRGGQFKLYKFRKYDDVRLAWAPEDRAATFGGDLDNFSFPRFAIDAAFIRLYEDGRPVETPIHFAWNADKPTEGEAVFVSGNPGATQRLLTMDQLATIRDVVLPLDQLIASELRGRLIRYSEEGEEQAFIAMDPIVGLENTYKRGRGRMAALIDPGFMTAKAAGEADFMQRYAAANGDGPDPWGALEAIQPTARELYPAMALLEGGTGLGTTSVAGGSQLFAYARTLVRGAQERAKPSDQRLPEFADSRLSGVQSRLFAERPTYPELEQIRLEWWLSKTREWLTVDNPYVATLLGKDSPEGLSARLVESTKLADPAVRRALWEGGLAAVQASTDPMIRYALAVDADARAVRAEWEEKVQAPTDRASEELATARFAAYGDSVYPDATGTLRLTYGLVEGSDVPGQRFSAFTTFAGLWDRATGAEPFAVAPKLLAAKDRIDPNAVMDMAVSTDTIGGSSGSPAINARGQIIGANFDSTVLTQRNAYGYDRAVNRSVIVTTQAVTVALRDVYGMDHLVEELGVSQ
ncbi:MAG: peptidase [Brevundimonas sp.]|uniref:Dipeptidyl-peptidase n=1 Tax=Brevundimonas albigilva TaxID=1312364 RepID=A0ABY4SL41_9CAUL|nr:MULTISPECIES: S46 family peptidase [Brevundimonas]PZU57890.1 MAG: peptidase [Brevundimonas sp.]UQV19464.1 S46 family peptidase [Brevundimonas albigilva]URI15650.1 S46 family peptidase [Brevundimonas albigilva]